jgi:hypothetical protein
MRRAFLVPAALAALLLAGCAAQIGPRTIPRARFDYGEALARSWNEQLLLNLVRLRYRDTPQFLDVGSVVTHFTLAAGAGAEATVGEEGDFAEATAGANAAYAEEPTITYSPLQGNDFVARLLAPVSPANLVLLSQSGWSIERLLLCCVQKINGLRNATGAAGPTPDYAPPYEEFQRVAKLLRSLQIAGVIEAEMDPESQALMITLADDPGPLAEEVRQVRELLGLPEGTASFPVTSGLRKRKPGEIAMAGRSLLSVLFFLSQAVEVPEQHEREGRVTVTLQADKTRFDWTLATGGLLRVRTSPTPPADAAVRVRYRGHWFYIADTDLHSKTTFSLLTYLFSLKSGNQEFKEPVLTLGVR